MFNCNNCGFELYNPIHETNIGLMGLYDDARFPGRSIFMLKKHYESLDDVPPKLAHSFLDEIQHAMKIMKQVLKVERVNVSVLGNTVSHVHAHLIPRFPENEKFPGKSPWNDPRPHALLPSKQKNIIISSLRTAYL